MKNLFSIFLLILGLSSFINVCNAQKKDSRFYNKIDDSIDSVSSRFMKSNLFIILLILCISQLGCATDNYVESHQKSNSNGNYNQNVDDNTVLNEELELNRKLWLKSNINDYNFKMKIYETGLTGLFSQIEVKVRNKKAIEFNISGNNQNTDYLKDKLAPYDTIEKLFTFIQEKFEQKQEYLDTGKPLIGKFSVTYDQKLGFPNEIKYTPFSGALDGDLFVSINRIFL